MRRTLLLFAAAWALSAAAASADAPKPLSPWDAQFYAAAFEAAGRGEFAKAEAQAAKASDGSLRGTIELRRLLHPEHKAGYAELVGWLAANADHPEAARVHALAIKRRPAGVVAPSPPAVPGGRRWADLAGRPVAVEDRPSASGRTARELFYSGETVAAHQAAVATGETWVAGLAAFRLGRFEEALRRFDAVARDGKESPWLRAAGGFWAARAATAGGSPELAPDFLRQAAAHSTTFYGLLAERQLGLEPEVLPPAEARLIKASATSAPVDLRPLLSGDARAKRAAALAQVGQVAEAEAEAKLGLAGARTEADRRAWLALAQSAGLSLAEDGGRFNPTAFPTPALRPQGGFIIDPALVYAVVRQESRFNPRAGSPVGASGLMQLMPATAAEVAGDPRLRSDPSPLHDPAFNLRLGQTYLLQLLKQGGVEGDLLRALAAYNGGRGAVLSTRRRLGGEDDDVLMHIESLPYAETRNYVERVMANYWIYRRMFGADSATLDAVASGARTIDPRLDAPVQLPTSPGPQRLAVVDVRQGL
jgi:soluble lytic murein transglycosylase-like protein